MIVGGTALVRTDIAARREVFRGEAQALQRLLGERMAQHEAIAATLALNLPRAPADGVPRTQRLEGSRLPPGLPALKAAWVIGPADGPVPAGDGPTPPPLDRITAPATAALAWSALPVDGAPSVDWWLLREPSHALGLCIDLLRLRDDPQWPEGLDPLTRVVLERAGRPPIALQAGPAPGEQPWGWTAGFRHEATLETAVGPMRLRTILATGPAEWPWGLLLACAVMWLGLVGLAWRAWRERAQRQRSEQLMRLARTARLNTMGEMAAGLAHELNQPLAATLAGTQAALRLLRQAPVPVPAAAAAAAAEGAAMSDDEPSAIAALELAAAQARRAADVVGRLRRLVQAPAAATALEAVDLRALLRELVGWLRPELDRHAIRVDIDGEVPPVRADRVALEQVMHNLIVNAQQALVTTSGRARGIRLLLQADAATVQCRVFDNGPGLGPAARSRLFEPFFTTRADGLGLGLSLSQSLMQAMGGSLELGPLPPSATGTCMIVRLPRADAATKPETP